MKIVKIKSLHIQNFGNIKDLSINFGRKTLISGRNEVGKTTINDAYSWLMTNKLANGSQADGIRPHDRIGIEDDNAVISVSAVIEIDGAEKEFLKEQRKEFTQKTGKFKGNNNLYFINGVPKKEKEYKVYVEEKILEPDNLELCTNASVLLNMDTKKRRPVIFDMVPDITDADVAATDMRFANIPPKLDDCTLDELIQSVRYQINGRGRGDKGLKGRQDELPARIDEAQRKVCDTAEYSLAISGLKKEIADLDEQEKSLDDVMTAYDQKSKDILDLKFEQSEVVRKANEGLVQQRKTLDCEIFSLNQDMKSAENSLRMAEMDLRHAKMGVERHTAEVKKAQEDWKKCSEKEFEDSQLKAIQNEEFDKGSLICPTCGQHFPPEQEIRIRTDFEKRKAERIRIAEAEKVAFEDYKDKELTRITESGNKAAADLKESKKAQAEAERKTTELKQKITSLAMEIQQKQTELSKLPESVDLSDNAEYQKITGDIEKAESTLHKMENGSEQRREISRIKNEKTAEISRLKTLIAESEKAQERVDELKEEKRNVRQLLADCQRELDLLKDFQKAKCNMLSEAVNKMFVFVKWRLFKMNQDGEGYQEVCEPMIENEPYGRRLNHGSRALAELDICNTFQNIHGISLPLFVDDFDGITENTMEKINQFDRQMIFLKATESDLKIEILE